MNPVVHFEMPAEDPKRVSKFYSTVFGWNMHDTGPEMGGYVMAHTAETDADNMVKTPGAINGGFFPKSGTQPNVTSVVIQVDDVRAHMQKVTDAGGKVMGEPQEIPGVGLWVVFTDSEGNQVSMIQPTRK
ncbi:MAG: VOC family protein [Flavobacteriales bacterium]|nr:VOC family protein [Flavobacteriales bacterium]